MARTIKKGSNRAKAQPFLEALAAEGLSANKALGRLRELGLGYRRADFLADYRKVIGKEKAKAAGKYVGLDRYPGPACEVETNKFQKRKYNYLVNYSVTDLETGETEVRQFIVASDERLTRRAIEQTAFDVITEHLDEYGYSLENVQYSHTEVRKD